MTINKNAMTSCQLSLVSLANMEDESNAFQLFDEFNEYDNHEADPTIPLSSLVSVTQQSSSSTTPSGIVPRRASQKLKRKLSDDCRRSVTTAARERFAKRNIDDDDDDDLDFRTALDDIDDDADQEQESDEEDDTDLLFDGTVIQMLKSKNSGWSTKAPAPLKKRRKADVIKEKAGPQLEAKRVKTELGAFQLFFDDDIVRMIVESTNREILKNRTNDSPTFVDTCKDEINCLLGLMLFRGMNHDIKNRTDELWYGKEVSRALYRASMTRNRFQFLLQCFAFHSNASLRRNIITDPYAKVRGLLDKFEENARKYYKHTELVCLDETLRNFFAHECDLRVFMPDKPGKMGIFFYTLGDGIDRYFSRIIPKTKPAVSMSQKDSKQETYELAMKITSDIHHTGRHLTADRGFSSRKLALDLYERDVTYAGTIKKNISGLPAAAKDFKNRDLLSTEFFWLQNTSLMLVSYYPKKNKPVLLVTTAHDQPTLDGNAKKKPEAILFYNEQRCGVDIVNRMVREYKTQPKCDDYRIPIFTFLLDIGVINSLTILKYNLGKSPSRRHFMRQLIHQLTAPWLKHNFGLKHHKADTVNALKACLSEADPNFDTSTVQQVKPPGVPARCFLCVDEIRSMIKGAERKRRNKNLNKHKWFCPKCRLAVCTKPMHRVVVLATNEMMCKRCVEQQ